MKSPQRKAQLFNRDHPAPKAPREEAHHKLHGHEVEDNYTPLQKDTPERQAWLDAQKERLAAYTADSAHHGAHPEIMEAIFPPYGGSAEVEAGGKCFSVVNDGTQQKNMLIVRNKDESTARLLFDPNNESPTEVDRHSLITDFKPNEDGSKIIISFSAGGTANSYAYVMDVEERRIVDAFPSDNGLEWVKGKTDTVVHQAIHQKEAHYCLQEHIVGDNRANDRTIFEFEPKEGRHYTKHVQIETDKEEPAAHEFLTIHSGTQRDNGLYVRAQGETDSFDLLFDDQKSTAEPIAEVDGKLLMLTDRDAPMGRLVAVDYDNPAPENWQTIIPENPDRDLESVEVLKGKLVANYIEDAQSRMAIFETDGTHLHEVPLPDNTHSTLHDIGQDGDKLRLMVRSYTSTKAYDYDLSSNAMEQKTPEKEITNPDEEVVVERIYATSKDGTQVPMNVVHRKDVKMDGTAATLLTGYGGFDIPMSASQDPAMKHFIEQGGIFVEANLRGGGEGGAKWYDEGRLQNKQNVFDDFAACAETLSDKGYTCPERLMAKGASNGGLLVLATALQRPELFGSIVSHAPVADLMDAATWPSDYGEPRQSPEDFDAAIAYSPLQNIDPEKKYPAMMVCVAENDDIVPEHQGMKFVANMNEKSPNTLCMLHREENAGHYAGQLKTRQQVIDYQTILHDFVEESLGPIDQEKYKAAAAQWEEAKTNDDLPTEKPNRNWRQKLEHSRAIEAEETTVGIRI